MDRPSPSPINDKNAKTYASSTCESVSESRITIDDQFSSPSPSPVNSTNMPERLETSSSYLSDIKNFAISLLLVLRSILCAFIPSFIYTREKSVAGKTIVITGGAFGLGRLMSVKLAARGAKVVILDINSNHMQETVNMINESDDAKLLSGQAFSYYCDVSDRSNVYSIAKQIESEVGPVDILIMNAGVVNGGSLLSLKDESIIRLFNINTFSHFWLLKAFLPSMMRVNSGHIVSIDSVASYWGTAELSDYCASKAASHRLQEAVDFELRYAGYDGIKVTSIMPYFMNTGMFAGSRSKYIDILEPETVADASIKAILSGKTSVFVPWIFHFLRALTYLVSFKAYFYVHRVLFGGQMMSEFTGRQPSSSSASPDLKVISSRSASESGDSDFVDSLSDKENNSHLSNKPIHAN